MTGAVLTDVVMECGKNVACNPEPDRGLGAWFFLAPGIIFVAWAAISIAATVHIAYSQTVGERRAGWISAVWLLPFIGPAIWWVAAVHAAWLCRRGGRLISLGRAGMT